MAAGRCWTSLGSAGLSAQERAFVRLCRLVGVLDQTALVQVPNAYTKDFLETRRPRARSTGPRRSSATRCSSRSSVDESLDQDDIGLHDGRADRPAARCPTSVGPRTPCGHTRPTDCRSRRSHPLGRQRRQPARVTSRRAPPTSTAADLDDPTAPSRSQRRCDAVDHFGSTPTRRAPAARPFRHGSRSTTTVSCPAARAGPLRQQRPEPAATSSDTRLNPKYTFDTFVIGASNRFAHAAAVAVAEAPAKAYNPLFVYGESGLGKTHLLHAIGHYARTMFPNVRVRYVNSEEFTNDFINSIRDDKASAFQARYRSVDVLLIDDIQFLQGKLQTQEEFFHTFNTLHNANKQIVITSRPAAARAVRLRGPDAHPLRVGPAHRRAAARPRDPHRHPAQEGDPGPDAGARRRPRVHRDATSAPTSASSRAR